MSPPTEKCLESQRALVTDIARKITAQHETTQQRVPFTHWWQRRRRRDWSEGFRLATVIAQETAWHSMP